MPQVKFKLSQIQEEPKVEKFKLSQIKSPTDIRTGLTPKPILNLGKTVAANLPSKETLISGAGGTIAGLATGSPLVGSATMAGLDQLLNPESIEKTPLQNITDVGKNTLINEVLGGLFSAGGKVTREIIKPGSTFAKTGTPAMREFQDLLGYKPTASQISNNSILNTIENTFSKTAKEQSLENSAGIVKSKAEDFIRRLTGRSDISLETPFKQAGNIQTGIEKQFDASMLESGKRGLAAKVIAEANPKQIPVYTKISSSPNMVGPNGLPLPPVTKIIQNGVNTVKGPVPGNRYLQTAKDILDKLNHSDSVPDPDSPLMKDLASIIKNNSGVDANGKDIALERNFGDMWESKQDFGNKAFSDPKTKLDKSNKYYTQLYHAVTEDIQNAIPTWQKDGGTASRLFEEARQISAKRHDLFDKAPIAKLVNEETGNVPTIDKIIADPIQLKKTLISGHLQIPDQGEFKYITSNTRKDLQGYELQSLLNQAKYVDNNNMTLFDGQKLLNMFADPNKQESYKALFSAKNRADITQFFKNIERVSQKGQTGMGNYWLMRLAGTGMTLSAGLLSGLDPISSGAAGVIGGTIGLNQLGKLLTDQRTARLMVSAANGGPINMPIRAASRLIADVLKNTPLTLHYDDGNKVEGKINSQGKFTIPLGDQK